MLGDGGGSVLLLAEPSSSEKERPDALLIIAQRRTTTEKVRPRFSSLRASLSLTLSPPPTSHNLSPRSLKLWNRWSEGRTERLGERPSPSD